MNNSYTTTLSCEIIKDLLPSYAEDLTGSETNSAIAGHLEACPECFAILQNIRNDFAPKNTPASDCSSDKQELDYLKKIRRRWRTKLFSGVLLTAAILCIILFIRFYIIGFQAEGVSGYEAFLSPVYDSSEICLVIQGALESPFAVQKETHVEIEGDTARITFTQRPAMPFENRNGFYIAYEIPESIHKVYLFDFVVWENERLITERANRIYAQKHPYIGDASANGRLADAIGMGSLFGNYKNILQTTTEPYEWTFQFEEPVKNEDLFNRRMQEYACLLLALTDNLGEVSWEYPAAQETDASDSLPADAVIRKSFTAGQARQLTGSDSKIFSENIASFQELLRILYLN